MAGGLNDKQTRFLQEYLIDYNATQAAIRAGYSKKTSYSTSFQILQKSESQDYLAKRKQKISDTLEITATRIKQELARIGFGDAREFFDEEGNLIPIHKLSDDAAASIAGMDVEEIYEFIGGVKANIGRVKKIKRYDKVKALELLGKTEGIFEKDNEQSKQTVTPFTDSQVDKIIESLKGKK
jgi:phage terminase small subunit